jgi:D-glycero-D-manno-heptose 1,7-bisphosphate phosphatase
MTRPAAFLDRDGVLNRRAPPHQYIASPKQLRLLPGVGNALRNLQDMGLALVVVTNQQGVGRGEMTLNDLDAVHQEMRARLASFGVRLDGVYACPHLESAGCDCRKPRPGLLLRAAAELDLAPGQSVMIGDSVADTEAGFAARCGALVRILRTGEARDAHAHAVCRSLPQAVRWLAAHRATAAAATATTIGKR